VYALNLTHSPENPTFWECADPLIINAGKTEGALETSADRHPGVADSIELDNGDGVPRRASEKHPKVLGEASRIGGIVAEYGRPT
jgi:hypothetical protein